MKKLIAILLSLVLSLIIVVPAKATAYGDVDENGVADAQDALAILHHVVKKITLTDTQCGLADVNGDDEITATDALLVLHYSISKISEFPANIPLPDTLMLYDCETKEGTSDSGRTLEGYTGPLGYDSIKGSPTPIQGNYSYCVLTTTDTLSLSHNMANFANLSDYDYIELDVYCSADISFNWNFGLATKTADNTGASWKMQNAWLPAERWTHIKMPISAFGDFTEEYGGKLGNINRINLQLTNIIDTFKMFEGSVEPPVYTYIYFDNIVATKNGAGTDNEFINVETMLLDPPDWYDDYYGTTCNGGLFPPMYWLFDGETDEGCEVYTDQFANEDLIGPTEENSYSGAPAPTEGDHSYCINTSSNQIEFSKTNSRSSNITPYKYIEMDVYCSKDIVFDFEFSVMTDTDDTIGATWSMSNAWLPAERWTHIKMPFSEFGDFTDERFEHVKQIKIQFSNIVDTWGLLEDGVTLPPDNTYIYIDNIFAIKSDVVVEEQLIDFETLMITPPDWYDDYLQEHGTTCGGGLYPPPANQ